MACQRIGRHLLLCSLLGALDHAAALTSRKDAALQTDPARRRETVQASHFSLFASVYADRSISTFSALAAWHGCRKCAGSAVFTILSIHVHRPEPNVITRLPLYLSTSLLEMHCMLLLPLSPRRTAPCADYCSCFLCTLLSGAEWSGLPSASETHARAYAHAHAHAHAKLQAHAHTHM